MEQGAICSMIRLQSDTKSDQLPQLEYGHAADVQAQYDFVKYATFLVEKCARKKGFMA